MLEFWRTSAGVALLFLASLGFYPVIRQQLDLSRWQQVGSSRISAAASADAAASKQQLPPPLFAPPGDGAGRPSPSPDAAPPGIASSTPGKPPLAAAGEACGHSLRADFPVSFFNEAVALLGLQELCWTLATAKIIDMGLHGQPMQIATDEKDTATKSRLYRELKSDSYGFVHHGCAKVQRDAVMLDIGGNIGVTAILYAKLCPETVVLSFEPTRRAFFFFRWNQLLNNIDERYLRVFNEALGPVDGEIFIMDTSKAGRLGDAQGSYVDWKTNAATAGKTGVQEPQRKTKPTHMVGFATMVNRENIRGKEITFVKLDCESCEYTVVPAIPDDIWENIQAMGGEVHPHLLGHYVKLPKNNVTDTYDRLCKKGFMSHMERAVKCR